VIYITFRYKYNPYNSEHSNKVHSKLNKMVENRVNHANENKNIL
jgi:hypothetical protein